MFYFGFSLKFYVGLKLLHLVRLVIIPVLVAINVAIITIIIIACCRNSSCFVVTLFLFSLSSYYFIAAH